MVGHHAVAGSVAYGDGSMTYATIAPSRMERYTWDRPVAAFQWPMDAMERLSGIEDLDYDGLLARFQAMGQPFWIARIWKNYGGLLDMHVRFSCPDKIYYYVLDFAAEHVGTGPAYDLWPQPRDFYLARAAIPTAMSWTLPEYDDYWRNGGPGSMPDAGVTESMPAADDGMHTDDAMPAGDVAMETDEAKPNVESKL